jgi:hypothetical protein
VRFTVLNGTKQDVVAGMNRVIVANNQLIDSVIVPAQ